jgi:electron transport complex protein RnfE
MAKSSKNKPTCSSVFLNGLIKENPTFVLMLGMCPTLAVTSSAINGMGMGLTTTVVLTMSNIIISLLRKVIPDKVRIPAFIVIIASFVTIVGQFLEAFVPSLNASLGIFIPLIVVNCIILGRAEAFASKNNPLLSAFDGIGMGLGFTVALTCIGLVREIIGAHKVFGVSFYHLAELIHAPQGVLNWIDKQDPIAIFVMAPGAFFVLAALTAAMNKIRFSLEAKGKKAEAAKFGSGCVDLDCANCADAGTCNHKFIDTDAVPGESLEEGAKRREAEKEEAKKEVKEEAKAEENSSDSSEETQDTASEEKEDK